MARNLSFGMTDGTPSKASRKTLRLCKRPGEEERAEATSSHLGAEKLIPNGLSAGRAPAQAFWFVPASQQHQESPSALNRALFGHRLQAFPTQQPSSPPIRCNWTWSPCLLAQSSSGTRAPTAVVLVKPLSPRRWAPVTPGSLLAPVRVVPSLTEELRKPQSSLGHLFCLSPRAPVLLREELC